MKIRSKLAGGVLALFAFGSWWMATQSPTILNSRLERAIFQSTDTEEVEWLLAHGANPNLCFRNTSPSALSEKWNALVAGNSAQDGEGIPLLCLACLNGNHEVAGLLLKYGANPNVTFEGSRTPLTTAIESGSLTTVRLVLEHGGDTNLLGGAPVPLWLAKDRLSGTSYQSRVISLLKEIEAKKLGQRTETP